MYPICNGHKFCCIWVNLSWHSMMDCETQGHFVEAPGPAERQHPLGGPTLLLLCRGSRLSLVLCVTAFRGVPSVSAGWPWRAFCHGFVLSLAPVTSFLFSLVLVHAVISLRSPAEGVTEGPEETQGFIRGREMALGMGAAWFWDCMVELPRGGDLGCVGGGFCSHSGP